MREVFDCVCVGLSTVDVISLLGRPLREDDKLLAEETLVDGGGPAGTAACAMSRFGLKAAVLSFVGRDLWAPFVREGLERFKVSTRLLVEDPRIRTPLSIVLVNRRNASRTIVWRAAGASGRTLGSRAPQRTAALSARCLHFDGHLMGLSVALAREARKKGILVSYDCGSVRPGWRRLAELTDVFIASSKFARQLGLRPAEAAARLRARFGFRCAVTAGEKGTYWFDEARGRVSLLKQRRYAALDTTGCGDVFHGAFLAAYLRRPDVEAGLRFAQRVAGLKTLGLGGRASIPARADV